MIVDNWRDPVDAVVVGMGPGGEEVAGRLADAGLDVVGVDQRLLGGECPYYGCIPSKAMVRAADLLAEAWRVPGMAGTCMVEPSWAPVARHVREATADWSDKAAVDRFTARGGRFLRGRGRITGPGEVTVEDESGREIVIRPRRAIVLGTGSEPAVPPIPGLAGTPFWTNREAVAAEEVPRSLAVLGGGAVGLELAQVFARFGADVTVVEAAPRLLPAEEPEAGELLLRVLTEAGLTVHLGSLAAAVGHDGSAFTVDTDRGDRVTAERLLVATGRRVDVEGTGLAALGLGDASGLHAVPADDRMRVLPPLGSRPGVWAIGDAVGRGAFTHVAMAQADVAVRGILGEGGPPWSDRATPRVTFTEPEVGAVGLTEHQAVEQGLQVRTGTADLRSGARGRLHGPGGDGFVKVVADTAAGTLVGATAAGPAGAGGEMVSALTLAVHARVPVSDLARVTWAFPTFHRTIAEAVKMVL
ncbi:pyridine nucleotide-disulfide oxidoreductase [Mangrovactinospora gilvigrisea]|uniref:Pyridine nucleotide-disulfide oxidoreductase n=2 Tax=Mangrovactinospora gilvigrisea TaxID=1428644 RepID=A0A1J7BKR6_9ACTN|nr:pyridine nucleotide-disulfide oxidoreductase [Mangrovactinospora gilvigrisea]